jgi:hypothetical protein
MRHKQEYSSLFIQFGGLVAALVKSWYFFLKLAEFFELIEPIEEKINLDNRLILKVKPRVSMFWQERAF